MNSTTIQQNEKTAQFVWTGFILLFFLIQAVVWIVAISITSGDTSHAVVAGYDEQALKWDESKSIQHASDALGWKAVLTFDSKKDIRGNQMVNLSIVDQNQNPVENAAVSIRAFHCGHAANVQQLSMSKSSPGNFTANLRVRHSGNWQFEGAAIRNDDVLLINQRHFIAVQRNR